MDKKQCMLTHAFGHRVTPRPILLAIGGGRLSHESHVLKTAEIDDCPETGARALHVPVVQNARASAFNFWVERKRNTRIAFVG